MNEHTNTGLSCFNEWTYTHRTIMVECMNTRIHEYHG